MTRSAHDADSFPTSAMIHQAIDHSTPPRLRHDLTGRSVSRPRNRREKQWIDPQDEPWIFIPHAVLESAAYRSLSINARRVLDRLIIENSNHKRLLYGGLRVSARQLQKWGVTKDCLTSAIRELEEKGLITKSQGDRVGDLRPPYHYRLTFYGTLEGPPTNEWKKWQKAGDRQRLKSPLHKATPRSKAGLAPAQNGDLAN